jgi:hypothetical protein
MEHVQTNFAPVPASLVRDAAFSILQRENSTAFECSVTHDENCERLTINTLFDGELARLEIRADGSLVFVARWRPEQPDDTLVSFNVAGPWQRILIENWVSVAA